MKYIVRVWQNNLMRGLQPEVYLLNHTF